MRKLRIANGSWLFGAAGEAIGYDLHRYIEEKGEHFDTNIHIGIHEYAERTKRLYEEFGHRGQTSILVAGVTGDGVAVYGWLLDASRGQLVFSGASAISEQYAIGSGRHGSLYFSHSYHSQDMNTVQRIALAHLCVTETCKQDPRVGAPVEIGLVRIGKPPQIFGVDDLAEVQKVSESITNEIREILSRADPRITGL